MYRGEKDAEVELRFEEGEEEEIGDW